MEIFPSRISFFVSGHISSKQMEQVDALSRYQVVFITYNEVTQKNTASQSTNDFINQIRQAVEYSLMNDFFLKNSVLYKSSIS